MSAPERVLVLDGHTTQALACTRSLGRAGYDVLVASHRRAPLATWSRFCRARYRLAGERLEAFAALIAWARERDVRVVLPVTERSCVLCNTQRRAWEAAGIIVGCADDGMIVGRRNLVLVARAAGETWAGRQRGDQRGDHCQLAFQDFPFPFAAGAGDDFEGT